MNALNAWKALSIGLMAILASGLVAPRAYALLNQDILSIVQNIQFQVNNKNYGLQAIFNKVNTGANQSSINNLQTTVNSIKSKTDKLPARPASVVDVVNATKVITTLDELNRCLSTTIGPYADLASCPLTDRDLSGANLSHAVLANADLTGDNLDGTNFDKADLTSINTTGCHGTPTGTPAIGTLPTCS